MIMMTTTNICICQLDYEFKRWLVVKRNSLIHSLRPPYCFGYMVFLFLFFSLFLKKIAKKETAKERKSSSNKYAYIVTERKNNVGSLFFSYSKCNTLKCYKNTFLIDPLYRSYSLNNALH